ncbi:hypothetical protein C8R44DRAFT_365578 [Mycena epipterygia]|nr:hypothetical protein C8R44DRAFT_365578 [Mycena epipterygia]
MEPAITPHANGGRGKRQSAPHATAHQKPSDADIAATHQTTADEHASDTRPAPPARDKASTQRRAKKTTMWVRTPHTTNNHPNA